MTCPSPGCWSLCSELAGPAAKEMLLSGVRQVGGGQGAIRGQGSSFSVQHEDAPTTHQLQTFPLLAHSAWETGWPVTLCPLSSVFPIPMLSLDTQDPGGPALFHHPSSLGGAFGIGMGQLEKCGCSLACQQRAQSWCCQRTELLSGWVYLGPHGPGARCQLLCVLGSSACGSHVPLWGTCKPTTADSSPHCFVSPRLLGIFLPP